MAFITLEGIDGAGKTTNLEWIAEYLRSQGLEVLVTREPGGTPLGESLRALLLNQAMHIDTEALLMFAARREHIAQVIQPALDRGVWVLSDRFTDASFAYQCGGRGIAEDRLGILESWVQQGLQPDLTVLFDVDVAIAHERVRTHSDPDRFEQEQLGFFERVRSMYLHRAAQYPERFRVVRTDQSISDIRIELKRMLSVLISE
ncbi:dTMP kinase [Sulfuriferula nivalis]|uniref:Thymidylate kinase n=1 Tax=Sulfuriferula nivalis TaxID=2675298 RepID=A0A809RJW5_9PROT|nr:dTMP kinase [Sulfuriferula nivalis]BBP01114.1 thymidylate kinase [Sulfuriferula nivalis]